MRRCQGDSHVVDFRVFVSYTFSPLRQVFQLEILKLFWYIFGEYSFGAVHSTFYKDRISVVGLVCGSTIPLQDLLCKPGTDLLPGVPLILRNTQPACIPVLVFVRFRQ